MKEKLFDLLPRDWAKKLEPLNVKNTLTQLDEFLESQKDKVIYPKRDEIFNAFNLTKFDQVKIVILGQDPYHQAHQAHGLSFSVQKGIKIPPSLRNIYKELEASTDFIIPEHGDLSHWSKQGILLLNTVLTVEDSKAGAHQKQGWEDFTDSVISCIDQFKENVIFVLWGKPAQLKEKLINSKKHYVLKSVHPSPLSAYRGFFGCQHFNLINQFLVESGQSVIDWQIR